MSPHENPPAEPTELVKEPKTISTASDCSPNCFGKPPLNDTVPNEYDSSRIRRHLYLSLS